MSSRLWSGFSFDPKIFHIRVVGSQGQHSRHGGWQNSGKVTWKAGQGTPLWILMGVHGAGIGRGGRWAIRFYSGGTSPMNQRRPT